MSEFLQVYNSQVPIVQWFYPRFGNQLLQSSHLTTLEMSLISTVSMQGYPRRHNMLIVRTYICTIAFFAERPSKYCLW